MAHLSCPGDDDTAAAAFNKYGDEKEMKTPSLQEQ